MNASKDKSDFAAIMSGVKRLHNDRINLYPQRPNKTLVRQAQPEQHRIDVAHRDFASLSPPPDAFFDLGIPHKIRRKFKRGQLPIDDSLDLHGCTQKTGLSALSHFFQHALAVGYRMVVVIHGKGQHSQNTSVLKPLTLNWLSQQDPVLAWCPAQPRDGGQGASYVYLRRSA